MDNNKSILIIEPSIIIFEGISRIIETVGEGLNITHIFSLQDAFQPSTEDQYNIVLVNPIFFNENKKNNLFSYFSSANIIGLISTYTERDICNQFAACIYLNDKREIIRNTISKIFALQNEATSSADNSLSEREEEILKLLVNGKMNKEIAEELFISIHTVITHRKNIIKKLGVKSTAAMAIYAVANNIIDLDDSLKSIM